MYLRVVRRSLDSVIVYNMFIYPIFDVLFVLSYLFWSYVTESKIKIYLLTYPTLL